MAVLWELREVRHFWPGDMEQVELAPLAPQPEQITAPQAPQALSLSLSGNCVNFGAYGA